MNSPFQSPFANRQSWNSGSEAPQASGGNWSSWFSRGTQQGGYNPFSIFGGWMNRQPSQPAQAPGTPVPQTPVPQTPAVNPNEANLMWSQSTPPGRAITDADHALPFLLGAGRSIGSGYQYQATDPNAVNPMIAGQRKAVGYGINLIAPEVQPTPRY